MDLNEVCTIVEDLATGLSGGGRPLRRPSQTGNAMMVPSSSSSSSQLSQLRRRRLSVAGGAETGSADPSQDVEAVVADGSGKMKKKDPITTTITAARKGSSSSMMMIGTANFSVAATTEGSSYLSGSSTSSGDTLILGDGDGSDTRQQQQQRRRNSQQHHRRRHLRSASPDFYSSKHPLPPYLMAQVVAHDPGQLIKSTAMVKDFLQYWFGTYQFIRIRYNMRAVLRIQRSLRLHWRLRSAKFNELVRYWEEQELLTMSDFLHPMMSTRDGENSPEALGSSLTRRRSSLGFAFPCAPEGDHTGLGSPAPQSSQQQPSSATVRHRRLSQAINAAAAMDSNPTTANAAGDVAAATATAANLKRADSGLGAANRRRSLSLNSQVTPIAATTSATSTATGATTTMNSARRRRASVTFASSSTAPTLASTAAPSDAQQQPATGGTRRRPSSAAATLTSPAAVSVVSSIGGGGGAEDKKTEASSSAAEGLPITRRRGSSFRLTLNLDQLSSQQGGAAPTLRRLSSFTSPRAGPGSFTGGGGDNISDLGSIGGEMLIPIWLIFQGRRLGPDAKRKIVKKLYFEHAKEFAHIWREWRNRQRAYARRASTKPLHETSSSATTTTTKTPFSSSAASPGHDDDGLSPSLSTFERPWHADKMLGSFYELIQAAVYEFNAHQRVKREVIANMNDFMEQLLVNYRIDIEPKFQVVACAEFFLVQRKTKPEWITFVDQIQTAAVAQTQAQIAPVVAAPTAEEKLRLQQQQELQRLDEVMDTSRVIVASIRSLKQERDLTDEDRMLTARQRAEAVQSIQMLSARTGAPSDRSKTPSPAQIPPNPSSGGRRFSVNLRSTAEDEDEEDGDDAEFVWDSFPTAQPAPTKSLLGQTIRLFDEDPNKSSTSQTPAGGVRRPSVVVVGGAVVANESNSRRTGSPPPVPLSGASRKSSIKAIAGGHSPPPPPPTGLLKPSVSTSSIPSQSSLTPSPNPQQQLLDIWPETRLVSNSAASSSSNSRTSPNSMLLFSAGSATTTTDGLPASESYPQVSPSNAAAMNLRAFDFVAHPHPQSSRELFLRPETQEEIAVRLADEKRQLRHQSQQQQQHPPPSRRMSTPAIPSSGRGGGDGGPRIEPVTSFERVTIRRGSLRPVAAAVPTDAFFKTLTETHKVPFMPHRFSNHKVNRKLSGGRKGSGGSNDGVGGGGGGLELKPREKRPPLMVGRGMSSSNSRDTEIRQPSSTRMEGSAKMVPNAAAAREFPLRPATAPPVQAAASGSKRLK